MRLCRGNTEASDYYVDVSPPPQQVTSSSTINIACYQDEKLKMRIPSDIIWTKIHQGWQTKLPDLGHTYICSPNDIGSVISAQILGKSPRSSERNTLTIRFGPITLDPLVRPTVQLIIKNCVASYGVSVMSGSKSKDYILHLSESEIQIKDPRSSSNIKSTYSAVQPQFLQNSGDSAMVTLVVPKQNQDDYCKYFSITPSEKGISIKIKFQTRAFRDSFIVSKKAFVTKRQVRLMNIIQNSLDDFAINPNSVEALIQMSNILAFNQFLVKKREIYKNQVQVLQQEIQNIKNIYEGLLKQKAQKPQEKQKFDPLLSLLDSSDTNSKRFMFGHSQIIQSLENIQRPLKLPVIGQVSQIQHIQRSVKISKTSQNVIYSQVYPFNSEAYSKQLSLQRKVRKQTTFHRNNTISQKSLSDPQSILDSSAPIQSHHSQLIESHSAFRQQSDQKQLYSAWQQQAHKNFILQSKIMELQKAIQMSKKTAANNHEIDQMQVCGIVTKIEEKQNVIQLLSAENSNLKLQVKTTNSIKEAYVGRCEKLQSIAERSKISNIQPIEQFQEKLQPLIIETNKLIRQSVHLGDLLRETVFHSISQKNM